MLRPFSGQPIDRRGGYRVVARVAKAAGIPRHISPHSLRHAAITNALDAGVPLRDAQILARHADPRTTEHDDRARSNLDRQGVHFLTHTSPASERHDPSADEGARPSLRTRKYRVLRVVLCVDGQLLAQVGTAVLTGAIGVRALGNDRTVGCRDTGRC